MALTRQLTAQKRETACSKARGGSQSMKRTPLIAKSARVACFFFSHVSSTGRRATPLDRPASPREVYSQWTRLRVAFLGALHEARCGRGGGRGGDYGSCGLLLARRVAETTFDAVASSIYVARLTAHVGGARLDPGWPWFFADWWRDAGCRDTRDLLYVWLFAALVSGPLACVDRDIPVPLPW